MERFKKYWRFTLCGTFIASCYPLYMGFRVVCDMIAKGAVFQEDYPKYIIPYTPISLAVIAAVLFMPLLYRYVKKFTLLAASAISLGVFFLAELLLESKVIVTSDVNATLESWQMYMCISFLPAEGLEAKTQRAVDVLIGDYSPTFKLHFYFISVLLIISILNCLYGFAQIIREEKYTRLKALIVQSVCTALFLGLCILACFTAFFRNGEITVPAVSAVLMSLFFVVFGVTAGVYAGSFLLGRKSRFSVALPAVIAAFITLLMYIGEMCLLSGNLYRFGTGFLFAGIPGIVFAPIDLLIMILSGCITAVIGYLLNRKQKVTFSLSCILLLALLTLTACAPRTSQAGEAESLFIQGDLIYLDSEEVSKVLSESSMAEFPKKEAEKVFYYKRDDLEVVLYQTGWDIYALINGQKLFFAEDDWAGDNICLYDINGDGILDISLYGWLVSASMVHSFFISTEDGTYRSLGSVVWDYDDENYYNRFPYGVSLLDGQKVHVELEEFGIDEIASIDDSTMEYAYIPLGIYDENGNLTDDGKTFMNFSPGSLDRLGDFWYQPWAKKISYSVDENGKFIIHVKYDLPAGYFSFILGCGFIFDWTIEDGEYSLLDVRFFEE